MNNQFEEWEETKSPFADLETKDSLEQCIWILDYFVNNDNKDIDVFYLLYMFDYHIYDEVIDSFKKYFSSNLFKLPTTQAKQDYIKKIIYEFHWFSSSIEQFTNGTSLNGIPLSMGALAYEVYYKGLQVDRGTKNIIHAWFFFVDIMDKIQETCFILNLDFLTFCSDLYISSETFVPKLALVIREKMKMALEKETEFKVKSFNWTGTPEQFRNLFNKLIDPKHGFIDPKTDFQDFTAIFSNQTINDNFHRVKWIKAGRNKQINKLALIDLLTLMDISKSEIEDNGKIKTCFSDRTGNSITFSQGNLAGNKSNFHSECYTELTEIFKLL